jgi:microcystin-dependent protein
MSQFDFGNIDPYVVDGVQLAGDLNQWRDALYAKHRGANRPSYVVPGLDWLNDAAGADSWVWNFFSGATRGDLALFNIDTVSGIVALADAMQAVTKASTDNTPSVATCEFVQAAIQAALQNVQGLAFPTGSVVDVMGALSSAPAGWVMAMAGTIGDAGSGGTIRANPDCHNLFLHIWNGLSDTDAPVSGGRGATAQSDWQAKKTIGGLDFRGCVRATYDSLGGAARGVLDVFSRLGQFGGEQRHVLAIAEMPTHTHSVYDPGHDHAIPEGAFATAGGGYNPGGNLGNAAPRTGGSGSNIQINFAGGDQGHNNIQPTRTVTTLVKL